MTPFQIFITALIIFFLLFSHRYVNILFERIITILITIAAIFLVLSPESATAIAHLVGIGRGSDMIIYLFMIYSWFWFNTTTNKMRASDRVITELVRKIAIETPVNGTSDKGLEPPASFNERKDRL